MIPDSPGDFTRKVFLSKDRKQRRSTGETSGSSSGSSIDSEQTETLDLTLTERSVSSQSSKCHFLYC